MNEFDLRRSLARMPRSRSPARDLWPDIAARIQAPARTIRARPWPWLSLAAAALLALVLLPQMLQRSPPPPAIAQTPPLGDASAHAQWPGSVSAVPSWVRADPEVAAALEELAATTVELHRLIAEHPESSHLVSLLHGTYRQQRWLNRYGVGQMQALIHQES